MNRTERRQAERDKRRGIKPQRGSGHIQLPINIRFAHKHEVELQMRPHAMLDCFREGTANEVDLNSIILRLNWFLILASKQFSDECIRSQNEGLDAMRSIKARHARTGKMGISQPEYEAIGHALNAADDMQLASTRRELHDALTESYEINRHQRATEAIKDRLDVTSARHIAMRGNKKPKAMGKTQWI